MANHRSILLIYTGGTIGMVENPASGALEALDFTYLYDNVPELRRIGCEISVEQLTPPIDSSAITPQIWEQIATIIETNYNRFDGFVVLHGTDTMSYTASALSFMLEGLSKPVVFTGSQLPIGKLRTDGKENLITAIEIAAATLPDGQPRVPEVTIFFENYLMRANRACKVSADQFNAFASFNYPELAYAGIDIRYNDKMIYREEKPRGLKVNKDFDPNVVILKLFPGITPEVVEAILGVPRLKGVVLETFGSGNAPKADWFIEALSRALARGVVIVNVTQCPRGYVDMGRYATGHGLQEIGLVSGFDSTTEAALTKLMHLIGLGYSSEQIRELMGCSLRGEISIDGAHESFYHGIFKQRG